MLTLISLSRLFRSSYRTFWCTRCSRCTRRATPCCKEGKDVLAWRRRHASTSFPLSDPRAGREHNGHTMQFRKTKKPWGLAEPGDRKGRPHDKSGVYNARPRLAHKHPKTSCCGSRLRYFPSYGRGNLVDE